LKIEDALYVYPGTTRPAIAHLRVYKRNSTHVAIVGQLTDNYGLSVTNAAELIFDQLATEFGEGVVQIEYWPAQRSAREFDRILIKNRRSPMVRRLHRSLGQIDHESIGLPDWRSMEKDDVERLTGAPVRVWSASDYTSATLLASGTSPPRPERGGGRRRGRRD
jgi:hypothetical protein